MDNVWFHRYSSIWLDAIVLFSRFFTKGSLFGKITGMRNSVNMTKLRAKEEPVE